MKNVKLDLSEKKPAPALKKEKAAAAPNPILGAAEKDDLVRVEDVARVLDIESRRELRALLTAYPALANDPEVRALDAAIQDDINNRVTPGLRSLQTRVQQQRARIEDLRRKLKEVEHDAALAAEGVVPVPGKLPEILQHHFAGDHASEYAILAKGAHRATQRSGRRGRNKVADETDTHDEESASDSQNNGQSTTGFH